MAKRSKIVFRQSLFLLVPLFFFFRPQASCAKEPVDIRVAIVKDAPDFFLSVAGPWQIVDAQGSQVLYSDKKGLAYAKVFLAQDAGFKIKGMIFRGAGITIIAAQKAAITVNKRRYRGAISIFINEQGRLIVVNTLDVESYIRGVLNQEISYRWHLDAIKAQAVAARTYALYQRRANKAKKYDVMADTSSQVYGGYFSERCRTNRAVNLTYGEVLTYQGSLFEAFFCATCGGVSEDANELWQVNLEPLKGCRACYFCSNAPHYQWQFNTNLKTIQKNLADYSKTEEKLIDIVIMERNATGRVKTLELDYEGGKKVQACAKDFRALMGSNAMRSTNFYISKEGETIILSGKGWGHGVGLCQYGALGMAKKGYSYRQILEFYYPKARIMKIY